MSDKIRHTMKVASFLILINDEKLLMVRRFQSGWEDGKYTLPSGHIEQGEFPEDTIIREAKEEVDLNLIKVELVHVQYQKDRYVDFYFTSDDWSGEAIINAPDECDDIQWFPIEKSSDIEIPDKIRIAIKSYLAGNSFSVSE